VGSIDIVVTLKAKGVETVEYTSASPETKVDSFILAEGCWEMCELFGENEWQQELEDSGPLLTR
jgi:hypothetical protein